MRRVRHLSLIHISTEVKRLILQWKKIVAAYNEAEDIKMVYSDGDLIFRTVRDMLSSNIEAIVCNDADTVRSLTQAMKERNIKFYDKVRYYEGQYDICLLYTSPVRNYYVAAVVDAYPNGSFNRKI